MLLALASAPGAPAFQPSDVMPSKPLLPSQQLHRRRTHGVSWRHGESPAGGSIEMFAQMDSDERAASEAAAAQKTALRKGLWGYMLARKLFRRAAE